MKLQKLFVLTLVLIFAFTSFSFATDTEEELTNKFMQRLEKKNKRKVTWLSGYFSFNRINRDNDYNKFAYYESSHFNNTDISWIGDSKAFGMDFGIVFNERYAWSVGGEYWMQMGEELTGNLLYNPSGTIIENPTSEIKVYGFQTGLQYYLTNPPEVDGTFKSLAIRSGFSVGFYQVNWDVWSDYNNLNLSTSVSTGNNTTFKDNAPSFSLHLGADYPTKMFGMVFGLDMSYLYMNFDQVAWYNTLDEEIVASYDGSSDGRVDLNFSGVRGKVELKRFFSW